MKEDQTVLVRLPFIVVFVLLTLGIAAAGLSFYVDHKAYLKQGKLDELSAIADLKVRELSIWRSEQIANALVPVRNHFTARAVRDCLARPGDRPLQGEIETWMRGFREQHGYQSVLLLDRTGKVRISIPDAIPVDQEVLEHVLKAPPKSPPIFTDFYRSGAEGMIALGLFTPLPDPDRPENGPIGFLVLKIAPHKFLYPYIQLWPTPSPTAETLLVERQGDEAVFLNELRHMKGMALTIRRPLSEANLPAARAALEGSGTIEGWDYRREPVLAAYRSVPDTPWVLVAKIDQREVYAPLRQSAILLALLVTALIVAAGALLIVLGGRQTARLHRLERLALEERDRIRGELLEAEKRSAAALRESEELLRLAIDSTGLGTFDYYPQTGELKWSDLNKLHFGLPPEARVDYRVFLAGVHPDDRERMDGVVRWLFHPESGGEYNTEYRTVGLQDGRERWIAARGQVFYDESGRAVRFVGTTLDISERKLAEKKIEELNANLAERAGELTLANQELETFSYTVAHDLRKPLTVVNGYCQALKELCSDKLDEMCKGYLQEAYDGTLRMNRLIEALLNFSRLAHVEPHREAVDLSALAQLVAAELKSAESERRVSFRIAEGITVDGDPNLLRVVLDNLLGNAWKYTAAKEEALIELGEMEIDGQPAWFVRDNGEGFDMAVAEKLFIPFQRLPGTEEFKGFGIGLATVERIIRRHGGRTWAEGMPGKGATFYFTL